ncbi:MULTISPECIES: hypothetical protein [Streptomyces]|uniref:Secreted protein n=1 Tax=Streptomyces demainii TaxID=588122 RepID=A0ABT9KVC9_9ACTN|nr:MULTISPECIES: hypothetical protein [Streptomyces]MDN3061159.1 hypothetical protein [Streptomyces sp. SRF1]MDP9612387.1 hypothetical protein [Streptomyces demainii]
MRRKNGIRLATGAMAITGSLLMAPMANADASGIQLDTRTWTRSCGTKYQATMGSNYARTLKVGGGSCKGDAWVRVRWAGGWSSWRHHSRDVEIRLAGVSQSQHKGCSSCTIYTLPI